MTITLRTTKGSALTHAELDGNFQDLDGRAKPLTSGPGAPTARGVTGTEGAHDVDTENGDLSKYAGGAWTVVGHVMDAAERGKLAALDAAAQVPAGGTAGQVLKKISNADFDAAWANDLTSGDGSEYTPKHLDINGQMGDYTLGLADDGRYVRVDAASAVNLTVPANASVPFPVGTQVHVRQAGSGQVTVVPDAGVVINTEETLKLRKRGATVTLLKVAADTWDLMGSLEAAAS